MDIPEYSALSEAIVKLTGDGMGKIVNNPQIKLRSKPNNLISKNAWLSLLFILPNESNKPSQQTINFWFGENVVYTIFKANAWRGVTANNFPVVLIFKKKTYKEQLLCYHLLLILKPCYNYHCICASSRVHAEIWGRNNYLSFF